MIALLIAATLTQAVEVETWTCFVEPNREGQTRYETTFVVTGNRVVSTGPVPQGFTVLQNNAGYIVFAASSFGVADFRGVMIDQLATVIAINKSNDTMRRSFLQNHGNEVEHVDGTCVKITV